MTDYTTYDDQALMRAIATPEGDQAAFTAFYKRHSAQLYHNILVFVKDAQVAEEAVQEVFARIWQRREHISIKDNIEGYLNTACRNIVVDTFRKAKKDRTLRDKLTDIARDQPEDDLAPSDAAVAEEQWQLLERALETLPPQRRKVFELCKMEGVSYAQACEQLGISLPTLKEHVMKAKRDIKDYLSGQGEIAVTLLILLDLVAD